MAEQTIEDLGKLVKAKYPTYASMPDIEVGQKVKAKYPEAYGHFTDVNQPSVPQVKPPGELGNAGYKPYGIGDSPLAHGVEAIANKNYARGANELIEGAMKGALPAAVPLAITNPIATGVGIAGGMGAQKGGEYAAERLGATPDQARLAGNIAGMVPMGGEFHPTVRGVTEGAIKEGAREGVNAVLSPRRALGSYAADSLVHGVTGSPTAGHVAAGMMDFGVPALKGMYRGAKEALGKGGEVEEKEVPPPEPRGKPVPPPEPEPKKENLTVFMKDLSPEMRTESAKANYRAFKEGAEHAGTKEAYRAANSANKKDKEFRVESPVDTSEVNVKGKDEGDAGPKPEGSGSPVDTSKIEVKPLTRMETLNPNIAAGLREGARRVNPDGSIQVLKKIPLSQIGADEGNKIYPDIVRSYKTSGWNVAPELRGQGEQFTTHEGHHRVEAAKLIGNKDVLAWIPEEKVKAAEASEKSPKKEELAVSAP